MDRRDFLSGAAATGLALASGSSQGAESSQRHGDLLIQTTASDHRRLIFTPNRPRPLRILQLTDTHFHPGDPTNRLTEVTLRAIVGREKPDFVVHTGDCVNNDAEKPVDWTGLDVMNGLRLPWTLCFGNHDYPVRKAPGSRTLEEYRQGLEHAYQGYIDRPTGRHYCYRYDVAADEKSKPAACLFFFQVGYAEGDRKISAPQLAWFGEQMKADAERGVSAPITVFVHIPLTEYNLLFESGKAVGQKGEDVCYDSDTGESFKNFSQSGRVVAVFCGHDHVNNYCGDWQGVELNYGRVSGWGGYGPATWRRGGRLLTFDLASPRPTPIHKEVF